LIATKLQGNGTVCSCTNRAKQAAAYKTDQAKKSFFSQVKITQGSSHPVRLHQSSALIY